MQILYGTTNQAKLESMKRITESLGIELIGLKDLDRPLPQVDESGNNPLENAKLKAKAYYKAFSLPVFSCDSGLYFDNLEESLQPGTHVRRVNGAELTDDQMIEYYSELAKKYNNHLIGRYRNAICFIPNETTCLTSMDESLWTEPFIITSVPHKKRIPGFPLDSLSLDVTTKQYIYDTKQESVDKSAIEQGFKAFFESALSTQ